MGDNLINRDKTSNLIVENQENTAFRVDEQSLVNMECSVSDITGIGAISKIIEKLIEPRLMKKKRKEFEETLNMLEINKQDGRLTSDMSYNINGIEKKSTIEDRAIRALVVEEINKQENIESIACKCLNYIDKDFIQEKEVDDDWLYTFRDSVKNISSEELQAIWAKLLANEIQSPSTYSLRTLNILKTMSSDEANKFKQFVKLTITDINYTKRISTDDIDILSKYGINYDDIQLLEELGLIQEGSEQYVLPGNNLYVINDLKIINVNTQTKGSFGIYNTTKVGTELANIVTGLDNSINYEYIKDLMKKINKDKKYKILIGEEYKIITERTVHCETFKEFEY